MRRISLVFLLLVVCGGALSQPDGKAPPAYPKESSEPNREPTQKLADSLVSLDKAEADKQKEENKRRDEDRKLQIELLDENKQLGVYTFWLAVFTFFLGAAAIWQAIITRNTAKRQLRAYISVVPESPIRLPTLDRWHIEGVKFIIKNHGDTPAYCVRHLICCAVFTTGADIESPKIIADSGGSNFVMNPNTISEIRAITKEDLTELERQNVRKGDFKIHIWGTLSFKDAFDAEHIANWHMMYSGDGPYGKLEWSRYGNNAN